ncbi:MAG: hypothetical protein WD490_11135 [Opitutales bacterium]
MKLHTSNVLSISLAVTLAFFAGCGQNDQEPESANDFAPAPFNDDPEPEAPSGPQVEEPEEVLPQDEAHSGDWPPLHLEQVIPGESAAVIDGEVVFEGDQIKGITLREVESGGVVLQRGTNMVYLARGAVLQPDPEDEITGEEEFQGTEGDITDEENETPEESP